MTDRITGTLLMGLDVAVEFATLGEFRLVEADSAAPDDFRAAPLVRRPSHLQSTVPDLSLLPPASTAIARAAAESAARAAARRSPARPPLRVGARAVLPSGPRRRPASRAGAAARSAAAARPGSPAHAPKAAARHRGGAVDAGAQLCLFGR